MLGTLAAVGNLIPYFGGIFTNIIAAITAFVISPVLFIKTCINELITKLASHMLPAFMTQINILDTLDDSYTIKTNLGTIIRESKTGRITIIED